MLLTKAAPSQSVLFYASVRYLLSGDIDTILQQMIYYRIINNITTLLVKQELPTLPEHLSAPPDFSGVRVNLIVSFMCMFCRSLFVLLSFFFSPLCCLFFFDIQILITSLWYLQILLTKNNPQNTFRILFRYLIYSMF